MNNRIHRRRSEDTWDITYTSVIAQHFLKSSGLLHLANLTYQRDLFWANQALRLHLYWYRPRLKLWPAIIQIIQTAPCLCFPDSLCQLTLSQRVRGMFGKYTPQGLFPIQRIRNTWFGSLHPPQPSNIIPLGFAPFTCPFVSSCGRQILLAPCNNAALHYSRHFRMRIKHYTVVKEPDLA